MKTAPVPGGLLVLENDLTYHRQQFVAITLGPIYKHEGANVKCSCYRVVQYCQESSGQNPLSVDQQKGKGVYHIGHRSVGESRGCRLESSLSAQDHCRGKCLDEALVGDSQSPGGAVVKNPPANAGGTRDAGLIPGSGRSPGGGNGNSRLFSCLESPMKEEPGGLQSMGSQSQTQLSTHTCRDTEEERQAWQGAAGFQLLSLHHWPDVPQGSFDTASHLGTDSFIQLNSVRNIICLDTLHFSLMSSEAFFGSFKPARKTWGRGSGGSKK